MGRVTTKVTAAAITARATVLAEEHDVSSSTSSVAAMWRRVD
jgi:hypothetical protein